MLARIVTRLNTSHHAGGNSLDQQVTIDNLSPLFGNTRQRGEPAAADRLHLSQGDRLGLVLSVDHPRRLLALHHLLEAMHDDKGRGCD